jgi:hypothetical protein
VYYDNLWSTVLRYLGGVQTDERAQRPAALSGNDVSSLRSAGALLRRRAETRRGVRGSSNHERVDVHARFS